jgi:hypothetical protein
MDPLVPVLPNATPKAWPADEVEPGRARYVSLSDALSLEWPNDAHVQLCSVPSIPHRLKKEALSKHPDGVPMVARFFDCDLHGVPAAEVDAWWTGERPKFDRLGDAYPGTIVYRTRGGARIVGTLPEPIIIRTEADGKRWATAYQRHGLHLAREFGIVVDFACSDWTRLFRLPHATRDRKAGPERREIIGDPKAIGSWTYRPDDSTLAADLETAERLRADFESAHPDAKVNPYSSIARTLRDMVNPRPAASVRAPAPTFTGGESARARKALELECAGVASAPEGFRNPALNSAAWKLGRLVNAGELDEGLVVRSLVDAADRCGEIRDYGEAAVKATIQSGLTAGKRNLPSIPLRQGSASHARRDPAPVATDEPPPEWNEDGEIIGAPPELEEPAIDARPEIVISTDAARDVDAAIDALVAGGADVFQRGSLLVRVTRDASKLAGTVRPKGTPTITRMPSPRLAELLATHAKWIAVRVKGGEKKKTRMLPPGRVVQQIEARGEWPGIRPLEGIVESPVLRPDGTILEAPGYDAATGLIFEPSGTFDPVSEKPTQGDACRACAELLEAVSDFSFVGDAHRTAWLAAILTPLARYSFEGPAPLTHVDASVRGSGKTFLARIVGRIVSGREPFALPQVTDQEEERKRITSIAMQGDRLVLLDNVTHLGSPALEAALTSTYWQDRVLGSSESVRLPLLVTWISTGNNAVIRGDMIRRINLVRLEPDCEQPEQRTGFRHPDLFRWVADNRPRLVRAALTILRAYHAAGRPRVELTPWGSYEGWSAAVRAPLVFAGMPDPYETRVKLEEGDNEAGTLGALLEGWQEIGKAHGDRRDALTASAAMGILQRSEGGYPLLRGALAELAEGSRPMTPRDLGYILRRYRSRLCRGKRLDCAQDRNGVALWYVTGTPSHGAGDEGDCGVSLPLTRERNSDPPPLAQKSQPAGGLGIPRNRPHHPQEGAQ